MTPSRVWPALLATGVALALPAAAQATELYSQTDRASGTGYASDDYSNNSAASLKVAYDFTVPEGQRWQISRVDTIGSKDPGSLASKVNAFLYASSGAAPGNEVFRQTNISASGSPNYSVPLDGAPKLPTGTYWVSIQQAGATFTTPAWHWGEREIASGSTAAVLNPGGASTFACTDWAPKADCTPSDVFPDQLFSLAGSAESSPVIFAGVTRDTHTGTALLKVKVPGPGSLKLSGRDVVGAGRLARTAVARPIPAAGTYKLRVAARGRKKAKLMRSGKVRVLAAAVYTSPGASPTSRTRSIVLRKRRG